MFTYYPLKKQNKEMVCPISATLGELVMPAIEGPILLGFAVQKPYLNDY